MSYVIWSIEHQGWWPITQRGYVETLAAAGRFSQVQAEQILARANIVRVNECMIPVEALDLVVVPAAVVALDDAIRANQLVRRWLQNFRNEPPNMMKAKDYSDAWREVERAIRTLSAEDAKLVTAIHDAADQRTTKLRIALYYGDRDRADRTPRVLLYLHLGMLAASAELIDVPAPTSLIGWARDAVQGGAGHECAEWRLPAGVCAVCGGVVASETEH